MKALKYTMTITVEVLAIESIPALIREAAMAIGNETPHGHIEKTDGDSIVWDTAAEDVDF